MNTGPFITGPNPPMVEGFIFFYAASGQTLEEIETVQVVVRLPCCLYIPSTRYVFNFPNKDDLIGIVPEKIWTEKAKESTTLTSELVVPNQSVYLDKAELITEWRGKPGQFAEDLQARNMEFDRDPTGYFRYTRLTLEFDWSVPKWYNPSQPKEDHTQQIIAQMSALTLPLTNYFVDVYRTVTQDTYLPNIPALAIEDIRIGIHDNCSIRKHEKYPGGPLIYKYGYYPYLLGMRGIRSAIVSKPQEIIDHFRLLLKEGFRPPIDHLLQQSALAALERRDVKMAIIESFISLELYTERFYYDRLTTQMEIAQIDELISTGGNWRLTVRLKDLLRKQFGKAIPDINSDLWAQWLKNHNHRHSVIHRNLLPSEDEAQRILQLNESIKHIMDSL